jgi:hypothetical protein
LPCLLTGYLNRLTRFASRRWLTLREQAGYEAGTGIGTPGVQPAIE